MADLNPLKARDIKRLYSSIAHSRKALSPFRENRLAAVKQYVGRHYGDNGPDDEVPLDLLELCVQTYKHLLAAKAPRELVNTSFKQLKPTAYLLELSVERLVEEIKLKQTLQMAVLEALFSIGIVKIGLERGGTIEIDGETHDLGQPYCDVVHLDDWVHDCTARRWGEAMYMGNRYRLPYDTVMESPNLDRKMRDKLTPTELKTQNEGGDDRTSSLSQDSGRQDSEFREMIELWDMWLPRENLIITLPFEEDADVTKALRAIDYDGPEVGPYLKLSYNEVPENIMPLPNVAVIMDMQLLANSMMRKLGRQAKRQKTQLLFRAGDEKDAERIIGASDGQAVRVDNIEATKEVSYGGIDPRSLAFLIQVKELFSYQVGNLDALAGLGAMSDTVGQDKLISSSANQRIQDMQLQTSDFAHQVMKSLAWYLWTDPFIDMPLTKRVPGTDLEIPTSFTPEDREGDFLDYNFQMKPYSMQFLSPQEELMIVDATLDRVAPFMPVLEQQGITFNVAEYLKFRRRVTNVQAIEDMFVFAAPQEGERPMVGQPPAKSATTHRTYERINRPGATTQGKDAAMMQTLLGGGAQEAEMAGIGRPTG